VQAGSPAAAHQVKEQPKRDGEPGRIVEPERGAVVSYEARVPTYCPTLAEKKRLLDIIRARHPKLGSVTIEDFSSCVDFVTSCGRSNTLNTEHYPSYWMDEASRYAHN
jgi:hypothetical protein